jgi:hypothetical protein
MDNPETLPTLSTRDTDQVDVRENRGGVLNVDSTSGLSILGRPLGFL